MKKKSFLFFDNDRLCLKLSDDAKSLRGYEAPQNKNPAMLYKDGSIYEIPWQSVSALDSMCMLSFMPNSLISSIPYTVSDLNGSLKDNVVPTLIELSRAIEMCESKLDWTLGSIPTSSIYFFKDGSILLLSKQLSEIIDRFEYDNERFLDKEMWYAHNTVNNFGKCHFLFQLLYYALTGLAPFEDDAIRLTGFKAYPLELFFSEDNVKIQSLCNAVNKVFSQNKKFMYQVKNPYEYFRSVLEECALPLKKEDFITSDNPKLKEYKERQKEKSKRRTFFRTKGLICILAILGVLTVFSIAYYYINLALKAPETKDLNEKEIIEYYYDAYSTLNTHALEEPLKYGYNSPDLNNIATRYVTSTMQEAYEGQSMFIDARTWINDGMSAIKRNHTVFGVTDIKVNQISEDVFEAVIVLYDRDDYFGLGDENDLTFTEKSDSTLIFKYESTVLFTFKTRKTWREITNIETTNIKLLDVYDVPFVDYDNSEAISALSVLNMLSP